jgi:hypothetical protein
MDAAEVVIGEVKRDCVPQVFPLLGEAQGQPREPLDLSPHREVRPFYVAGRTHSRVWIADTGVLLAAGTFCRRVALLRFSIFRIPPASPCRGEENRRYGLDKNCSRGWP